jgi:glyoxylase-like metal-dependent hydrolase (beta-lactamase superfamily II)
MGNHKTRPALSEFHLLKTRYIERLAEVGVTPGQIDYVLCTHLHADHVGWNTLLENGRWVPTFPNATYIFAKPEYEAAKAEAAMPDLPPFLRQIFEESIFPIAEAGRAQFVDGVCEILDVLTLRPAPGHTPGHIRIEVQSSGERGVFAGDILHSPVQVPFWQWSSQVCWDRALAAVTRRSLLQFCSSENALLLPAHFEAPHVGRIREVAGTFAIDLGW